MCFVFVEEEATFLLFRPNDMSSFKLRILTLWFMFVKPDGNIQAKGENVALRGELIFHAALIAKFGY